MQLVIFDCDGVLIDSEVVAAAVEADAYRTIGFDISAQEFASRFAGLNHDRIRELVSEELGHAIPDEFQDKLDRDFKLRMDRDIKLIVDAHEALDRLDYPRCVCSNSGSNYLQKYLSRFELYDRFRPYVYAAQEVREGRGKPAPDVFLHAAEEFDVDPAKTCVIEDSAHGVSGAKAAGMRVIGFVGGGHSWPGHADALTEAGAETVVHRLIDIPATVDALATWREPAV